MISFCWITVSFKLKHLSNKSSSTAMYKIWLTLQVSNMKCKELMSMTFQRSSFTLQKTNCSQSRLSFQCMIQMNCFNLKAWSRWAITQETTWWASRSIPRPNPSTMSWSLLMCWAGQFTVESRTRRPRALSHLVQK